jgi:hypothetical protein
MVSCEGVTLSVDLGALNVIGMSVRSLISAFVPAPGVHGRCCNPVIDVQHVALFWESILSICALAWCLCSLDTHGI